jgi:hypothetical protein
VRRTRYGGTVGHEKTLVLRHEDEGSVQYELVALFRPPRPGGEVRVRRLAALRRTLARFGVRG